MASLATSVAEDHGLYSVSTGESDLIEGTAPIRRERASNDSLPEAIVYERSTYQPSARSRPLALLASAGAILAIAAAMATLNIVAEHRRHEHLTVVDIKELDSTPPPPPPEQATLDTPQPPTQVFAPKPRIELPVPGPQQAMMDSPPPPPPPAPSPVIAPVAAPAPAAPPTAAQTTMDGGDLSSDVLYAKPPSYPAEAHQSRTQGVVKLLLLVGSDGTVSDIKVAVSSGSGSLDRAALQAVRKWRWSAKKTAVRGYVSVSFVLPDRKAGKAAGA